MTIFVEKLTHLYNATPAVDGITFIIPAGQTFV